MTWISFYFKWWLTKLYKHVLCIFCVFIFLHFVALLYVCFLPLSIVWKKCMKYSYISLDLLIQSGVPLLPANMASTIDYIDEWVFSMLPKYNFISDWIAVKVVYYLSPITKQKLSTSKRGRPLKQNRSDKIARLHELSSLIIGRAGVVRRTKTCLSNYWTCYLRYGNMTQKVVCQSQGKCMILFKQEY